MKRLAVGTYRVERRCLCRGDNRYYSVKCPEEAAHGVWEDQDWHSENPVYIEPYVRASREYRAQVMAGRTPLMERLRGSCSDCKAA